MDLVDRYGRPLAKSGTTVATRTPTAIQAHMAVLGMDNSANLGPGTPMRPYQGYSQDPRSTDFPVGVNIGTSGRQAWGRTDYELLKGIIDAYDVARMCINHKIDELRSMELMFNPQDGFEGDVQGAVAAARAALKRPDRQNDYFAWLGLLLENSLRYDAAPLYRRRDFNGDIIGLEVLDGTTIFPFIDENGRRPAAPAPAYFQRIKGLPYNWFTDEDITFHRFRPQPDSPFGLAPIESVLLTANTDIKFQWHFLQMFTDGSVPAGFMTLPPDISSPDQVAQWQEYWDAITLGDQTILHKLLAVPNGSVLTETKPKTFDKEFPQYLMTRTAAAFGVVPQDLGLVDDVNRANGDTQVDVQFRINTLPWVMFMQGILNSYIQDDLGLPIKVELDTGRDKEDRLADAQAWQIGVETAAVSPDEMRQALYGLPIDNANPVPRGFLSSRTGFVPLVNVMAIAGPIDPETAAPDPKVPLNTTPFAGDEGVLPDKLPGGANFQRGKINPEESNFPQLEGAIPGSDIEAPPTPVAKSDGPTAGVTSDTGLSGVDLVDDEDDERLLVKSEMTAFRKFAKARRRRGSWRDFHFDAVDDVTGHRLNDAGRAELRKAAGDVIAAGLAVAAQDTGRVLLLQRALDPTDPAQGTWEFPGGHVEDGESPLEAAQREWSEETGAMLPDGVLAAEWTSPNGVYAGHVWLVADESAVPTRTGSGFVENPDDPDGDQVETIAWWSPSALVGTPVIRPELAADASVVLGAVSGALTAGIATPDEDVFDADGGPLAPSADYTPPDFADTVLDTFDALQATHAQPEADADPLAKSWRDTPEVTPQLRYDLRITDHYMPAVQAALKAAVAGIDVAGIAGKVEGTLAKKASDDPVAEQVLALLPSSVNTDDLEQAIKEILFDGYLTGLHSGAEQVGAHAVMAPGIAGDATVDVDWGAWQPGNTIAADLTQDGGMQAVLDGLDITLRGISDTVLGQIANGIADGLRSGDSVSSIADDIGDLVGSDSRAELIAHTETARAQTAASLSVYGVNGITEWDLITSAGACPICLQVAAANPHPVSDSSDTPPIHPRCRCSSAPRADSVTTPTAEDLK